MPDDVRDALDVDVDDGVKLLGLDLPQGGVLVDDGGVVEEQVRRAVGAEHDAGPRFHLVIGGDVHRVEVVRCAVPLAYGLDGSGAAPAADHGVAERDELFRHRPAQTARGARQDDGSGVCFAHGTRRIVRWRGLEAM
jgi:hypothetical protein